jgi:tetratricopeptide (TPR) repeat protein
MIEATCAACGTLNRVSEASVPAGARFVTCVECKARVAVPMVPASAGPSTKLPPASAKPPLTAVPPSAHVTEVADVADLPAPKRTSTHGSLPPPPPARPSLAAKPPERSGLAGALDPELPAPKITRPALTPTSFEINDLLMGSAPLGSGDGGVDLPAPKKAGQRPLSELPRDTVTDLPAPRATRNLADLPAPKAAPKPDLLAKPAPKPTDLPPKAADLPQRKEPSPWIPEPPAPKKGPTIPDLPAPRMADGTSKLHGNADLPAPKGFFDDLPQAVSPQAGPDHSIDLPAPKGLFDGSPQPALDHSPDLPAPKGFFDDLPQPALDHSPDLPAPKGFFDDLPQHKSAPSADQPEAPAPKGYFDNIPALPTSPKPEAPAPKGYFDNIPALPTSPKPEAPAPKGYFDNIPALPASPKPEAPAPKGYFDNIPALPASPKPEAPAPKGYFDNIPALPTTPKPEAPAPKGYFDDLPGRPIKRSDGSSPEDVFDDLPSPGRAAQAAQLGLDGGEADLHGEADPERDLVTSLHTGARSRDERDRLDPAALPIRFEHPSRSPAAPGATGSRTELDGRPTLELEAAPPVAGRDSVKRPDRARPVLDAAATARARARRNQIVLGGLLATVVLGGGGFLLYKRHAAAQERAAAITGQLDLARSSYTASDPRHWQRAAAAARRVIELDARNPEALGIGAESLLASVLVEGTAAGPKIGQARAMLEAAHDAGISSPQLARARALSALVAHQPDGALAQLQPLVAQAPKDGALALYLGWALEAKGDVAAAIQAYDHAITDPAVKLPALYDRGNARLELAELEAARADFSAVLALANDHVGAQVGLATAQPASAAAHQEAELMAILVRKDLAGADPRAVARAWTRAGDIALRDGRYEIARERFRKALGVSPQDLAATIGLAQTELRDGKLDSAAALAAAALGIAKDNVPAQLVQSELEIKQHKLPLAGQRLAALASHVTPLAPLEEARVHLLTGELLAAQGKDDEALDAYVLGAKIARELDLSPLLAAVKQLAAMTAAAAAAQDQGRADALRARSSQLLGELAEHAEHDPQLAMMLGLAMISQGDADKAEPWLRRVVEARPGDAEARFQLGRALVASGKHDEAIEALAAARGLDPARGEIGVALARAYEAIGRDPDAGALYTELLAGKLPSVELRGRAGRFFARTGALDKAGEQGARIVEAEPGNAAGLYLQGEGLLSAGKLLEAKQAFQRALELERDPQYLEALGRAAEALARGGDRELQDLALRSYLAAAEAAPTTFNALAGQGRLYVARHEAAKAVAPLRAAAKLDPRNADVLFLLGAAYQELEQPAEALRLLEASTKISPRADAFWRIGQIARDTNRGRRAAAALAEATRLAAEAEQRTGTPIPWLTDALYLQGRVNFDLHHEPAARDAWTMYVARNPPASAQLTEVKQLLATSLRR